ncbi:putative alpha/beta hydrolase [Mycolicibacterium mengxianglii]|uniref:putative alpha/beta hydrolase n=1 Tax=Mycolicibacterium mengxianglii TaxID=2736649 RepID=UPI0018D11CA7|nr:hypothetical protein [Mycolicibacterium mengxianglii]
MSMPTLRHLSAASLAAAAGGDPWQVDDEIQAGDPGEISGLAEAFHQAGGHLKDAGDHFNIAKKQFWDSWDRKDTSTPQVPSAMCSAPARMGYANSLIGCPRGATGNRELRSPRPTLQRYRNSAAVSEWSEAPLTSARVSMTRSTTTPRWLTSKSRQVAE